MVSPCVLTGGRGEGGLWGLFYKSTNPIHEGSTLMTFPEALPPDTITLGARFQHMNLGGYRHSDHSTEYFPEYNLGCFLQTH